MVRKYAVSPSAMVTLLPPYWVYWPSISALFSVSEPLPRTERVLLLLIIPFRLPMVFFPSDVIKSGLSFPIYFSLKRTEVRSAFLSFRFGKTLPYLSSLPVESISKISLDVRFPDALREVRLLPLGRTKEAVPSPKISV